MFLRSPLFEAASDAPPGGGATTPPSAETPPPSHSSDPVFRQILGDNGQFTDGWTDTLPAEYDPYKATLANYKDFNGLVKSLNDNITAARAKTDGMIRLPGKDAKPEDIAAYHKALGVPEKPEDYGLTQGEQQMPEGLQWDQGFADEFSKTAHGLGLTPAQVQGLAQWHQQRVIAQHNDFEAQGTKALEAQQKELREAFGENYEKRIVDARRVAATIGLDPEDHPIFFRADTVKALTKVADLISEDKLVSAAQVANNMTPETQAKDIMTNPGNADYKAYNDPSDPRHKEAVARVNDLYKRAYPR